MPAMAIILIGFMAGLTTMAIVNIYKLVLEYSSNMN